MFACLGASCSLTAVFVRAWEGRASEQGLDCSALLHLTTPVCLWLRCLAAVWLCVSVQGTSVSQACADAADTHTHTLTHTHTHTHRHTHTHTHTHTHAHTHS